MGFGIENSTMQGREISLLGRLFLKQDHLDLLHALKHKPLGTIIHNVHKRMYIKIKKAQEYSPVMQILVS